MRETKEHTEAFNQYYLMGDSRSLRELARLRGVATKTTQRWNEAHNWQERIKLRDIEVSRKLIEKVDDEVVNTKADYRKMIKERLIEVELEKGYLTNAYGTAKEKLEDPENKELDVNNIKDLTELAKALAMIRKEEIELMKLDLVLMGEADSRTEHTFLDALRERRRQRDNGDT